jgi:hypothetical protein
MDVPDEPRRSMTAKRANCHGPAEKETTLFPITVFERAWTFVASRRLFRTRPPRPPKVVIG